MSQLRSLFGCVVVGWVAGGIGTAHAQGEEADLEACEEAVLAPSSPGLLARFGEAVAIEGDLAAVGSPGDDALGFAAGAVYVYERDAQGAWAEVQRIDSPDAPTGADFGAAVAIHGGVLVVGDPEEASGEGAVYVFEDSGGWTNVATLRASGPAEGRAFGSAVALSAGNLAIGAAEDDGLGADAGAVYLFTGSGTSWSEAHKLDALDGHAGARFGASVDLERGRLAVGAPDADGTGGVPLAGAVYVFEESGSAWNETDRLDAASAVLGDEGFGTDVDLAGDRLAVGAPEYDVAGPLAGAVYLFTHDGSAWDGGLELLASEGDASDDFGRSLALLENRLLVGAPGDEQFGGPSAGAVYVFQFQLGVWTQTNKLGLGTAETFKRYGRAVAKSGETLLVSALGFPGFTSASAYPLHLSVLPGCALECEPPVLGPPQLLPEPDEDCLSSLVPSVWQGDSVAWCGDQNPLNKIDDQIDNGIDPDYDIAVNFARCITQADVDFLNQVTASGTVDGVCEYITTVSMSNVAKLEVGLIAGWPGVAFIEQKTGFGVMTLEDDVNQASVKIKESADVNDQPYNGMTAESVFGGLDGTGVNIAIMDTGVANNVNLEWPFFPFVLPAHESVDSLTYVAGYDATLPDGEDRFVDPPASNPHGTQVASIIFGEQTAGTPKCLPEGIAPKAGLIDVRISNQVILQECGAGNVDGYTQGWDRVVQSLETLYSRRVDWGVDVINMSFVACRPVPQLLEHDCQENFPGGKSWEYVPSDGTDAFSQLVDLASSFGIVVVAACGNRRDGPGASDPIDFLATPGAASRAITVSGVDDKDTVTRDDDEPWECGSIGPRDHDFDLDCWDEHKPDISAPAFKVTTARWPPAEIKTDQGTSLATPHVTGVVALMLQQRPDLTPAAVKEILIRTAEDMSLNAMSSAVILPYDDTTNPCPYNQFTGLQGKTWSRDWGWGYLDAHAALSVTPITELTFPNWPPDPPWFSPDVSVSPVQPVVGSTSTVLVMVENQGGVDATDVRVELGVAEYSATVPKFQQVGSALIDVPAGTIQPATIDWIPNDASHQSLRVEIIHPGDLNGVNNTAYKSLAVAQSPVTFSICNVYTNEITEVSFDAFCDGGITDDWNVAVPDPVLLDTDDCPELLNVLAFAGPSVADGEEILVHVEATIPSDSDSGTPEVIGGVSFLVVKEDCNGNGVDDYLDIAQGDSVDCDLDGVPDECGPAVGYEKYGEGIAPANSMDLSGQGLPLLGGSIDAVATGAAEDDLVIFSLTGAPSLIPLFGGVLLVDLTLPIFTAGLLADDQGSAAFFLLLPDDPTLATLQVYLQAAATSGGLLGPWSFSNGLRITLCP